MRVSHETIYTSLYVQGRGAPRKDLAGHLRTGRAMRKPRAQGQAPKAAGGSPLRNAISISERPPEVEDRAAPCHWQSDLIMGASNISAIGTLVERATRYVILLHLPRDHTALTVQNAMCEHMARLPEQLRQTLTWDRGSETTIHAQIAEVIGLSIYFATPAHPGNAAPTRHQRPAAPVLPQRHRPLLLGTRVPRPGHPRDEQPTPQDPGLGHTSRSPRPTTLTTRPTTRRCTHAWPA